MLNFKLFLNEILDLSIPKAKKQTIVKDAGTNIARPISQYKFKTELGNEVKLQYEKKDEDSYEIVFYVNNTLYDNSSKSDKADYDPEILGGIFALLARNTIKAKKLTFRAFSGDKDKRIVRGLPFQTPDELIQKLNLFLQAVNSHKVVLIHPSDRTIELYKKLNKIPESKPDFNKEKWQKWIQDVFGKINKRQDISDFLDVLFTGIGCGDFKFFNFNVEQLIPLSVSQPTT